VTKMLKRRRLKKTDYKQRLALLKSGKPRLVVRRSLSYIHGSVVKYNEKGDITILGISSKALKNYGWKAHFGNLPSAYLTGLLLGLKAKTKNVDEVVLDIGLQTSVKGSSLYAFAKGIIDSGIKLNVNSKVIPSEDRIKGAHIANYAKILKEKDPEKYNKQFSNYLKNELAPEKLVEHFEDVKKKIIEQFKGALSSSDGSDIEEKE